MNLIGARTMTTNKLSFREWLKLQVAREDLVGDLAHFAAIDADFPTEGFMLTYIEHMMQHNANDIALGSVKLAWNEWKAGRN